MLQTIGMQLGYRYENSPICIADGTEAPPDRPDDIVPSARPGSRAPHVWLRNGASILDLFGRGFTLLHVGDDGFDGSRLADAAAAKGVPLQIATVGEPEAGQLYDCRLALIHPDGHVAWRGDAFAGDAGAIIGRVRGV